MIYNREERKREKRRGVEKEEIEQNADVMGEEATACIHHACLSSTRPPPTCHPAADVYMYITLRDDILT